MDSEIYKAFSGNDRDTHYVPTHTTHSVRSASTSKANNIGLSIKDIQKAAGWKGSSMFREHYKLPIIKNFRDELVNAFTK